MGRKKHEINIQDHQNAEAVLVHMQGHDVVEACSRCKGGMGVMQGCVVETTLGKGSTPTATTVTKPDVLFSKGQ